MSNNIKTGVLVIARNEEKLLPTCLNSIKNQTIPLYLVVVNDGSTDNTGKIAEKYADKVIHLPHHNDTYLSKPELSRVFNAGFNELKKHPFKHIMVSGADSQYPPSYVEEVVNSIMNTGIVVASGIIDGEEDYAEPRGSGRVIDVSWFEKNGFCYEEKYGFESLLLKKAENQGYKTKILNINFITLRPTSTGEYKEYCKGQAMKHMNYSPVKAILKILKTSIFNPRHGYQMALGYVTPLKN